MEETAVIDSTSQISDPSTDQTLIDTSSDDTSIETTDTNTSAEGGEGEAAGESTTTTDDAQPDEPAISGTKLSAAAKATLDEIRAKNPKLAAELKSALFEREAIRSVLPGGVKEFKEFQTKLEAVGGFEGIETLKSEAEALNNLDLKFTNADPSFVEEIADASPEAFAKLAPATFAKFQQISPDGFSKYIAGIFQSDMAQSGLLMNIERLGDFLQDHPRAKELFDNISAYIRRVSALASQEVKPIAKKDAPAPQQDTERQQFLKEKEEFTRNQWGTEASQSRVNLFNSAFTKETQGLKLTSEQTAAVKELYVSRLTAALKANNFSVTAEKYFKAGDKAGYLRYAESVYKQLIPKAVESALAAVAPGKKPGPKPGAAAPKAQAAPKTTANPGYTWVASRPATQDINWAATNQSMILKGMAVLRDGKKVQWRRS